MVDRTTWALSSEAPATRVYSRSGQVLLRSTTRGLVILPPRGEPLALVGAAASMWELLSDRLGQRELSERLSAQYHVPVDEVDQEITPVLGHLVDAGAVVLDER